MTESEWLASSDPAAMLKWLIQYDHDWQGLSRLPGPEVQPSDRKLRLFAQYVSYPIIAEATGEGYPSYPRAYLQGFIQGPNQHWANLLRDIVGNPFRPVEIREPAEFSDPTGQSGTVRLPRRIPRWLTPQVLSVAHKAYDDTGRIEDGSLDPVTLAVLSDAMEEAGCDNEEILRHLRGYRPCQFCRGNFTDPPERHTGALTGLCVQCLDDHGWEQTPGPHVRGCWVLDLILGKS